MGLVELSVLVKNKDLAVLLAYYSGWFLLWVKCLSLELQPTAI